MASNIRKNSQLKQLFVGFVDILNSSDVNPLFLPADTLSLSLRENTAVDMFPERQKPEKLRPL